MAELMPLLDRDCYSDEEWALALQGLCDFEVVVRSKVRRCLEPSSPGSVYRWCAAHDDLAREVSDCYGS